MWRWDDVCNVIVKIIIYRICIDKIIVSINSTLWVTCAGAVIEQVLWRSPYILWQLHSVMLEHRWCFVLMPAFRSPTAATWLPLFDHICNRITKSFYFSRISTSSLRDYSEEKRKYQRTRECKSEARWEENERITVPRATSLLFIHNLNPFDTFG